LVGGHPGDLVMGAPRMVRGPRFLLHRFALFGFQCMHVQAAAGDEWTYTATVRVTAHSIICMGMAIEKSDKKGSARHTCENSMIVQVTLHIYTYGVYTYVYLQQLNSCTCMPACSYTRMIVGLGSRVDRGRAKL